MKKIKSFLSTEERLKIINNGSSGMRSMLAYLDHIADELEKNRGKEKKPKQVGNPTIH